MPAGGCWRRAGSRPIPSQEVRDGHIEEDADVVVGDAVVDRPAISPGSYQAGEAQLTELVAGGGFGGLDGRSQVPDAQFVGFEQGVDHSEPARIRQELEAFGEFHGGLDRQEMALHVGNRVGMYRLVGDGVGHVAILRYLNIDSDLQSGLVRGSESRMTFRWRRGSADRLHMTALSLFETSRVRPMPRCDRCDTPAWAITPGGMLCEAHTRAELAKADAGGSGDWVPRLLRRRRF